MTESTHFAPASERTVEGTLRKLFLTVFVRGHSARGISKETAPKSLVEKLALIMLMNGLVGLMAFVFIGQSVYALSIAMHAITFMFVGMFVTASVGEVLFNKEESEILLHRPIQPRTLLRAKISVVAIVSLLMAAALNLIAFFVGMAASDGSALFPLAHALSTIVEALFCAGCAVLVLQLCLKWLGRERVESVMTTSQVVLTIVIIVGSQLVSRLLPNMMKSGPIDWHLWWIDLLPPAWFANIDDAIAGSHAQRAWLIGGGAVILTLIVLRLVFGRLADAYQSGMQTLGDSVSVRERPVGNRTFLRRLSSAPPLCWFLRDSSTRASFVLTVAYLARDRDVKLRMYPGLASFLVMPFVLLIMPRGMDKEGSEVAFGMGIFTAGAYLADLPLMALRFLKYSAHWRATEVFQTTPVPGPWPFHQGARVAVIAFLAMPLFIGLAIFAGFARGPQAILMLLPGVVLLPLFASLESASDPGILLSRPIEEAKAANRGCQFGLYMVVSFGIGAIAAAAWYLNFFTIFLVLESAATFAICFTLDGKLKRTGWRSLE